MAEEGTFCINADVVRKAGVGANATAIAEAYTNVFIQDAEAYINVKTRRNWITSWSSITSGAKLLLREAASNLAGIYAINYDMSGYMSRAEAEIMINTLINRAEAAIKEVMDKKAETFMDGA